MKRQAPGLLLATAIAATLFALTAFALPAWADVNGPCKASLAVSDPQGSYNANDIDSPGSAAEADEKATAGVAMYSLSGQFTYHRFQLEFAGFRWTVAEKVDTGTDDAWSEYLEVKDYAKFGVGLYKVVGYGLLTGGEDCIGIGYIKVVGRNPLTTVAGAVAAGAVAVGAVGVAAAGAAGAGTRKPEEVIVDEIEKIAKEEDTQKELEKARQRAQELRDAPYYRAGLLGMVFCSVAALPALLLTGMAMISEGGQPASPTPERRLPRLPWRPRISVVGLLGGLLAGAGAVVLLQQFSLVFPTRAVAIAGLIGGLAIGLIVPSLTRIIPVTRVNRRIAWLERRIDELQAQEPPAQVGP